MRTLILFIHASWLALLPALWANAALPALPALPVRGYILVDFDSGRVLAEKNAELALEPASITKILSAYVVYDRLAAGAVKLDDPVLISQNAYSQIGSRMFVEVNSRVPLGDLLLGMVVQSGNDATVALAEHVAGSEPVFADLMNQHAARLGLDSSRFINSTGLPHPEHLTTARDIATLVRALIRDFPDHYATYAVKSFSHNNIDQANRNKLLWRDPSVDGVKTGHTNSAGYCLAASAKRGDMRLISVVLGADNEEDRLLASQQLLNYGFQFFATHKLYSAGQTLTEVDVWQGETDRLQLGFDSDVYVTIPRGRYQAMQATLQLPELIEAPLARGQVLGSVQIRLDGQTLASPTLVATSDVALAGPLARLGDRLVLLFRSLLQ